jgi:hypothetical protein
VSDNHYLIASANIGTFSIYKNFIQYFSNYF